MMKIEQKYVKSIYDDEILILLIWYYVYASQINKKKRLGFNKTTLNITKYW